MKLSTARARLRLGYAAYVTNKRDKEFVPGLPVSASGIMVIRELLAKVSLSYGSTLVLGIESIWGEMATKLSFSS